MDPLRITYPLADEHRVQEVVDTVVSPLLDALSSRLNVTLSLHHLRLGKQPALELRLAQKQPTIKVTN